MRKESVSQLHWGSSWQLVWCFHQNNDFNSHLASVPHCSYSIQALSLSLCLSVNRLGDVQETRRGHMQEDDFNQSCNLTPCNIPLSNKKG